ncbi:Na/Pi cotransporter family protein [Faecalibacillus faecis]|uniref:Na/Pi cotransporter family protein n=1 Tax=Faecalibacillus faecis TaxID=1982628 RepID=UPI000664AC47|nr:Na/Pi cotransporter family protein [Faecalibacillus faecis]KMV78594.1 Na/Pi-cotransporter family protein [Coprobacillus sp. 8_1_38FAA]RGT59805.1 Na/Pi cotransporter family protein [Coprobacillus sp. AF18-40]RGT85572.1 Na/Pi cotransporter family protein [Coprobacillus sp. AF18-15LB]RHH08757.1 Na/Pi cotransporter family protein [Coprobacillus sp. AM18-4LB-d2]
MKLTNLFSMLGGLALFLYGMNMMSNGLEMAAGDKMKTILEKLTSNRILGVLVGALVTAIIQSSSATTVMVVGFVNSGLMSLTSAVWVIMGANIGTTITGQLIAIDITAIAPLIAFIGVAMIVFFKSQKLDAIGGVIGGLGILFIGMETMSSAMVPLRTMPEFVGLISKFQNPFIGILVGALFTALIQSSSASVGILQALAKSGVMTLSSSIYVLFGQNIGTCITSVLASIGTSKNAKRTTIIHLSFNIIGTVLFVTISMLFPFADLVQSLTPSNVAAQIANVHTIFNVTTTLLLLPIGTKLVDLACRILPDSEEDQQDMQLKYLDFSIFDNDYHIGTSAIANTQLFNETQHMLNVANHNVKRAFELLDHYDEEKYIRLQKDEEYINYLNQQVINFTTAVISHEFQVESSQSIILFLKLSSDLERIGDHAMNIAARAQKLAKDDTHFSEDALKEIGIMESLCNNILDELIIMDYDEFKYIVDKVDVMEDNIDKTQHQFAVNQLIRLKEKKCTTENSVIYTKILTDFERIGDHGLNIAESLYHIRKIMKQLKMIKPETNA